jgi:trk system potassium uptake protein
MLFWRSLTQWIGGLGIVFFTIAILPIFTTGGVQLFSAESTGVTHDRTHPKINVMAKWLWTIYLVLTVSETVLLMFGGMSLFDAICQSFATTATGGYSTKQNSISYWNSPYIEYVVAIFMIVSSINFSLFLMCLKGKVGRLFKDEELHWFLASVGILTFLITLALVFQNHYDWELAFRKALFQVSTVHTSCGFATDDYNMWPPFTWLLLFIAMLSGGCTGSTSGGIKNMRLLIVARAIRNEFKHLLHPNAVLPVRINKQTVSSSIEPLHRIFRIFGNNFTIFEHINQQPVTLFILHIHSCNLALRTQ